MRLDAAQRGHLLVHLLPLCEHRHVGGVISIQGIVDRIIAAGITEDDGVGRLTAEEVHTRDRDGLGLTPVGIVELKTCNIGTALGGVAGVEVDGEGATVADTTADTC